MPRVNGFGKRLRVERLAQGLTQMQLAGKCRLTQYAISHFETGRRTPSLANMIRLVDALDISADVLLGRC